MRRGTTWTGSEPGRPRSSAGIVRRAALIGATVVLALVTMVGGVVPAPAHAAGYDFEYCTWYAWQMRQDLPTNLGNAYEWAGNAASAGFTVDTVPRAGDIAAFPANKAGAGPLGHVAHVTAASGTAISLSEMNWGTGNWNKVTTRSLTAAQGASIVQQGVRFIHRKGFRSEGVAAYIFGASPATSGAGSPPVLRPSTGCSSRAAASTFTRRT